jgi:hypothetical protein
MANSCSYLSFHFFHLKYSCCLHITSKHAHVTHVESTMVQQGPKIPHDEEYCPRNMNMFVISLLS